MNAKQQIEEMARLLWHMPKAFYLNCYNDCCEVAKILYEEGYRKRSEGDWEKYGYKWKCSACGSKVNIDGTPFENGLFYCSHCGAKMKGE